MKTNLIILNFNTGEIDIYKNIQNQEDWEDYISNQLNLKLSNIEYMVNDNLIINNHG